MTVRTALPLVLALGLLPAAAQTADGPYWVDLPLPPGFIAPVTSFGELSAFQTPTAVWCFSAVHRRWTTIPAGAGATVTVFNKHGVIRDGNTIRCFSTRTEVVASLNVSPSAQIFQGSAGTGWVTVVRDGNNVWGYSAFQGLNWVPLVVPAGGPISVSAIDLAGVVHQDTTAWGFSFFFGAWVQTTAPAGATIMTNGAQGSVVGGGQVLGFSAHRNTWSSTAYTPTATPAHQFGYSLWSDGTSTLFFSGYTGSFSRYTWSGAGPVARFGGSDTVILLDGASAIGYASGVGTLATMPLPAGPAPAVQASGQVALLQFPDRVIGFSGVRGAFSAVLMGVFPTISVNQSVGFAEGAPSFAYSPILNQWTLCPSAFLSAVLVRHTVVIVRGDGYEAFEARTGTWSFQPTAVFNVYDANPQGAIFVAFDTNALRVFDAKLADWVSISTVGTATLNTWRQLVVAQDGVEAFGHCFNSNVWDRHPIQGTVVETKANSSVARVLTTTNLYSYCGVGSLINWSRYPDHTRFQLRGEPLRFQLVAPAGSSVVFGVSQRGARIPLGAVGTLFIDPNGMTLLPWTPVPGNGRLDVAIPLPSDPSWNAVQLHIQALVQPPAAPAWLTNSIAPILF
jgi:hypothetical protein